MNTQKSSACRAMPARALRRGGMLRATTGSLGNRTSTGTVGEVVVLVAHRGARVIAVLPRLAVLRQRVRERVISRAADTLALQHETETHASQSSSSVDILPLVEGAIPSAQGAGIQITLYFPPFALSGCLQAPSLTWSCSSARMRAWGL